ncbi:MAG: TonB-dependent receptor plug domain-containing protein, partial [Myxococcota bacterium]
MSRRFAFLLISVFAAGIVHAQAPSADGEEPEATEGASDEGSSEGTPNDAPAFSPPRVLEAPPADPGDRETRPDAVVMEITLDESGALTEAVPTAPLDADLEHAVREALRRWRFAPAMRDGSPFAARVRVSVPFAPPLLGAIGTETTRETPSAETPAESVSAESVSAESVSAEALPDETSPESSSGGFGATGETELEALRTQERGAGDIQVQRDVLEAAPRQDGADLLRTAPGVYLNRSEGDGVAHQIMLRGFDAEHGQDLEIRVGHLPINLPSHLHGQGYADLGFLIPEVVSSLRVLEGVSDPQQGDF